MGKKWVRVIVYSLVGMIFSASSTSVATPDVSAGVSDQPAARVRKILETIGKDIREQKEQRKLLYMVLLLQTREPSQVIGFYRECFGKKDPGSLLVRMALVRAYTEKNDFESAEGVLSGLVDSMEASAPKTNQALSMRARLYHAQGVRRLGERGLAAGLFWAAIEADPTFAPAYYALAELPLSKEEKIKNCVATLALVSPDCPLAKDAVKLLLKQLEEKK